MIRVFVRKTKWTPTDDLAFVGDPPLIRPPEQPVHVSVTFTWDLPRAMRLAKAWNRHYSYVAMGGPAFQAQYCRDFVPGRYIKQGVTFTSRGCPKHCPWCLVPSHEGPLREIPIREGNIIQDNNFLACSQQHCEAVYQMLAGQKDVQFKGGLDIDYLTPWHVERIKTLPSLDEVWVACDREKDLARLDKAADLLSDLSIEKRFCYVLIGFGHDTPTEAEARCEAIYAKGFLPFAQRYRPFGEQWPQRRGVEWARVGRKWARPAEYRHKPKPTEELLWTT